MTEQPEALRLATTPGAIIPVDIETTAMLADELRRLHEEVTEQARLLGISAERELALLAKIDLLEKQLGEAVWNYGEKVRVNQELLFALSRIGGRCDAEPAYKIARAAIAKAKEQT